MGINFPDAPALGQAHGPFTWDGVKWVTVPYVTDVGGSNTPPLMAGVASPGAISEYSRGDHQHPSDATRAPVTSPVLTGTTTTDTLTTTAWMAIRGTINTTSGRIVAQMPGAADQPSLCCYSIDRAYAMGMFLDTSNNIAFGGMDANGVPNSNIARIDGVGNFWLNGTIVLGRDPINWNDVATKNYADAKVYGGNYLPISGGVRMSGLFYTATQWVGVGHGGPTNTMEVRCIDAAGDAFISHYQVGRGFASNFGLSSDHNMWFGGWSHGWTAYKFWTTREWGGWPASNARLVHAGDYLHAAFGPLAEPYGGAAVTGSTGFTLVCHITFRYRYMQNFTSGWYTIGYV